MTLTLDPRIVEREAVTTGFPEVAGWLQEHLGQQLTAYLAGLRDAKVVGRGRRGSPPRATAEVRIRTANTAALPFVGRERERRMLVDAFGVKTTRAWFLGSNSRLDDEAPAWLLRHAGDPGDVRFLVPAARAFAGSEA